MMITKEIIDFYRGKKVLVTGGTGLIGREVVRILASMGAIVTSVALDLINPPPGVHSVVRDLRDFDACQELTKRKDIVINCMGVKGSVEVTKAKPASFLVPLLQCNTNMLEACRLSEVQRVVYVSSIGAYPPAEVFVEGMDDEGEPMDMYPGWAKRMAEMQIDTYKIQYKNENFITVRPCNVYGPGDNFDPDNAMVIPSLMMKIKRGDDPVEIWGDGKAIRDFAYSTDVAIGILLAAYKLPVLLFPSKYINLGSGIGYTVEELVKLLRSFIDFNYKFDTSRPGGFPKRVMDITLAKTLLGYSPETTLSEGLERTWNWFIDNSREYKLRYNYFKE